MLVPRLEIEAAAARIRAHLAVTPLVRADHFSRRLGANVFFELETLQPTHSFKVRGAFNALTQLSDEQKKRGVVTASGGNHGLAVALPSITSIAETLGARKTEPAQFDIVSRHASDLVTVSDDSAMQALLEILETEKLLTEPATSCSVAALMEGRIAVRPKENVVVVLCGANIALARVHAWATRISRD